jgi:hypothetical protein
LGPFVLSQTWLIEYNNLRPSFTIVEDGGGKEVDITRFFAGWRHSDWQLSLHRSVVLSLANFLCHMLDQRCRL